MTSLGPRDAVGAPGLVIWPEEHKGPREIQPAEVAAAGPREGHVFGHVSWLSRSCPDGGQFLGVFSCRVRCQRRYRRSDRGTAGRSYGPSRAVVHRGQTRSLRCPTWLEWPPQLRGRALPTVRTCPSHWPHAGGSQGRLGLRAARLWRTSDCGTKQRGLGLCRPGFARRALASGAA